MKQKKKKKKKKENQSNKEINDGLIKDDLKKKMIIINLKRISNFWNNNYFECESNGDKNRNLSLDEYLSKLNLT